MKYKHPNLKNISCNEFGDIFSFERKLSGCSDKNGYLLYKIHKKSRRGHRIIMECVLGRILNTEEHINHINFIKFDNSISNLEICTPKENVIHYHSHVGKSILINEMIKTEIRFENKAHSGSKNGNSKLTEEMVKDIIKMFFDGLTNTEIASIVGVSRVQIGNIRRKKVWQHVWETMPPKNN